MPSRKRTDCNAGESKDHRRRWCVSCKDGEAKRSPAGGSCGEVVEYSFVRIQFEEL
jgi:hypothetical protein